MRCPVLYMEAQMPHSNAMLELQVPGWAQGCVPSLLSQILLLLLTRLMLVFDASEDRVTSSLRL